MGDEYQVVVVAGGSSKDLFPLVSKDVPKALLPIGNRPLLSYVLDLLEDSNLNNVSVVVAGHESGVRVGSWIAEAYHDRLQVEVSTVSEESGTADALRSVAHRLSSENVMVVSGDMVCDVPLGAIASSHKRQRAGLTALLCPRTPGEGCEASAGGVGTKEKAKQLAAADVIGLDSARHRLLYVASGSQLGKEVKVPLCLMREAGQVELHTDLLDAHLYAFNRELMLEALERNEKFKSIKRDLVPHIVRSQLKHGRVEGTLSCSAYVAGKARYCARVNTIEAYGDINRDVAGDAIYLTGYTVSGMNNVIHPSAQTGAKTAIGPQCIIGEGSELGEKCSVKRSVVGRHCRIGSNVKVINSVVMNHVTLEDGCLVQNSVICSNVHLQERVTLKDCQVGCGYVIGVGAEHRSEALAKKEKSWGLNANE
ncbi:hypothetical protein SELMODRAFT_440774 [Selaginella moellendorffii]|uniref:Translation initiation factor eIF2B subunit gamma n=1 Tax=Selaginella moellendorffii TaxID=88036 RepID=D8REB8_SELML|nr:hypothetical protein SELMODRAFT_440774 [Selaginella moellendorffii]